IFKSEIASRRSAIDIFTYPPRRSFTHCSTLTPSALGTPSRSHGGKNPRGRCDWTPASGQKALRSPLRHEKRAAAPKPQATPKNAAKRPALSHGEPSQNFPGSQKNSDRAISESIGSAQHQRLNRGP